MAAGPNVLALGCIALSVLVYRRAPADAVAGARLFNVAIAYEVAMAFAIGIINQWQPQVLAGRLSGPCRELRPAWPPRRPRVKRWTGKPSSMASAAWDISC